MKVKILCLITFSISPRKERKVKKREKEVSWSNGKTARIPMWHEFLTTLINNESPRCCLWIALWHVWVSFSMHVRLEINWLRYTLKIHLQVFLCTPDCHWRKCEIVRFGHYPIFKLNSVRGVTRCRDCYLKICMILSNGFSSCTLAKRKSIMSYATSSSCLVLHQLSYLTTDKLHDGRHVVRIFKMSFLMISVYAHLNISIDFVVTFLKRALLPKNQSITYSSPLLPNNKHNLLVPYKFTI